jgi:hypothetical protein
MIEGTTITTGSQLFNLFFPITTPAWLSCTPSNHPIYICLTCVCLYFILITWGFYRLQKQIYLVGYILLRRYSNIAYCLLLPFLMSFLREQVRVVYSEHQILHCCCFVFDIHRGRVLAFAIPCRISLEQEYLYVCTVQCTPYSFYQRFSENDPVKKDTRNGAVCSHFYTTFNIYSRWRATASLSPNTCQGSDAEQLAERPLYIQILVSS